MVPSRSIETLVDGLLKDSPIRIPPRYPKRLSYIPDLLNHFELQKHRSQFDLRLGLAKSYEGLIDILNPKSWSGSAPKIEEAYPKGSWKASQILDVLTEHPRLRLQSPGGSGKTTFLASAVKACVDAGRTVFFLDLSTRVDHTERDVGVIFVDVVSVGASFDQFRAALKQNESGQIVLFVDGLNERSIPRTSS